MIETLLLGITGGLIAGVSRDVVKWYIAKRAGSQNPSVNILMLDKKHIEKIPSLSDDEGWADYVRYLNEEDNG